MTGADPTPLGALLSGYRGADAGEERDRLRVLRLVAGGDAWSRALPLHVTASALIVHPDTRRVLLRWHRRQGAWLHVGGHAEPGETGPLSIAIREAAEETGLDDLVPWPSAELVHLVVVPVPASATEPAHEHADLRFVLATRRPDTARPERPDAPLRWLSLPEARRLTDEINLHGLFDRVAVLLDRAE